MQSKKLFLFITLLSIFSFEIKGMVSDLHTGDELVDYLKKLTQSLRAIRMVLPATDQDRELFTKYPTVFEHWPEQYKKIILDYYNNKIYLMILSTQLIAKETPLRMVIQH